MTKPEGWILHLGLLCALPVTAWSADHGFPEPEVRSAYVLARDRLPRFPAGDRSGEPASLPDAPPASWPVLDLGGTWQVNACADDQLVDYQAIDETYGPLPIARVLEGAADLAGWRTAEVPWPESFRPGPDGKPLDFRGVVYYRRAVTVPTYDPATQEPFLVFTGAGFRTDAWLGGRYLGSHVGSWNRFAFPLGTVAKPGATLPLVVKCVHTRHGMSYHGRLSVGITEPLRLEIRPRSAVSGLRTRITADGTALEASFTAAGSGSGRLVAVVSEAVGGREAARSETVLDLAAPGFVRVPLAQPRWWSPEDPFLYRLSLRLDGVEVGGTRFGWRTIAIATDAAGKQRLQLNGKPLWMRAFAYTATWSEMKEGQALGLAGQRTWGWNHQGRMRDALLLLKAANIDTLRPHAGHDFHNETFFNLCDELGFLVYLDWNGGSVARVAGKDPHGNVWGDQYLGYDGKNRDADSLGELVGALHDHPSLAFISFGNEMYDWGLPAGCSWDATITRLRGIVQAADWQQRPLSGSSGRPVWEHRAAVDLVDHHQYIGAYYGTWRHVVPYLIETSAAIARRFGARLPFVNMETGDPIDSRMHGRNLERLDAELDRPVPDKAAIISALTAADELAGYLRVAVNHGGVRAYLKDLPLHRRRKGTLMVKHYLELFRWHRELTDGVSLNSQFHSFAGWSDPDFAGAYRGRKLQPWPDGGELAFTDPFWDFHDGFAPVQALAELDNPHPLGGVATAATLMVVNDTQQPVAVTVLARLRQAGGATLDLPGAGDLRLAPGAFVRQGLPFTVPAAWPSGSCALELAVTQGGRRLAGNAYRLETLAAFDRRTVFPNRALALYEGVQPRAAGAPTTAAILDTLGLAYQRISAFDQLDRFQVLIVGAQAIDSAWLEAGPALHRWISAGGRLLAFEQDSAGGIPFAADERVMKLGRSSFMEVWAKQHPIFAGIEDEMAWESPAGNDAAIFDTCLDLTDGFLAIASVGHFQDPTGIKAVVSNRRLGAGEYLLSMVSTLPRYGRDAVVTRYVENCLAYILGDGIAPQAVAARDLQVRTGTTFNLDNRQAEYLDLRPAMNRAFADEVANDGEGGWSDYGPGNDLRTLPVGFHRFDNLLPFWVVKPEANGGRSCLVLRGPTREGLPERSPPIPVRANLERLYFLHTLMWVKAAPGDPVLSYEVVYADGTTATIDLRNGRDLADWWKGRDLANANVIFRDGDRCVYASEWINPTPKVAIHTLTVRSRGNAIPIVIAITGRRVFSQRVDKTE